MNETCACEELDKYMGMTYVIIRTRENGIVASG